MTQKTLAIQVAGSAPEAKLVLYLQDYSESMRIEDRPLILLCPGGGYAYTSDREADPLALSFLAMGYHAAVLRYSCAPARFPTALLELASAMLLIRQNAGQWHVRADRIVVQGCSAGGHLAACLGTMWQEDFLAHALKLEESRRQELRPYGMLLCYPVITSGEFAHRGSFENLLGTGGEKGRPELWPVRETELLHYVSLEMRVTEHTPPTFLWHTFEDASVPMENSLLMAGALRRAKVPTELHIYPRGGHGLALANRLTQTRDGRGIQPECSSWLILARTWLENLLEQ